MRIVFLGSGEFGCDSLRWLSGSDSGHELLEVISQPARPAGRGRKLQSTPIAKLAGELGLPFQETDHVNLPAMVDHIKTLSAEVLLVIAFGQKIGPELLNLPHCRSINLHGSLLPQYRGAAPINWAIIDGASQTGLTVIQLNEVWDGGAILGQVPINILPNETAADLHDRLAQLGPKLLREVLIKIETDAITQHPQDVTQATKAPKLKKSDGAIDWSRPAGEIRNRIHGLWSWPGAYSFLRQADKSSCERITIARAQVLTDTSASADASAAPGTVTEDLSISCGSGRLHLLEVKPVNGKLMSFDDFVNGRHLKSGDRFTDA